MMGLHGQFKFIDDTCVSCKKEDELTGESEGERRVETDDEITGTPN
jgi:hypothetical protein